MAKLNIKYNVPICLRDIFQQLDVIIKKYKCRYIYIYYKYIYILYIIIYEGKKRLVVVNISIFAGSIALYLHAILQLPLRFGPSPKLRPSESPEVKLEGP